MLDQIIRFFRFGRQDGEFELLETERGIPEFWGDAREEAPLPEQEDTRKVCKSLAESGAADAVLPTPSGATASATARATETTRFLIFPYLHHGALRLNLERIRMTEARHARLSFL